MSEEQNDAFEETDLDESIRAERKSFDLIAHVKNRPMRTAKVTLGFDEVSADNLDRAQSALNRLAGPITEISKLAGIPEETKKEIATLKRRQAKSFDEERATLLEKLEAKLPEQESAKKALDDLWERHRQAEALVEELREKVNVDSISIELRAVPEVILKGTRRRTRDALGLVEKGIPAEREEEFQERMLVEIAVDQIVRYRYNATGDSGSKLTADEIIALRDFLPSSQAIKFMATVQDLQFRNVISEDAVAQADF